MSNADQQLDECGCCEGIKRLTPASIENLPGLTALTYRVGAHAGFKTTMQAALSAQAPLRTLTTRDDDDPAVALLDCWATVLDVLGFYQERIAGEGYLRTAAERSSILEMARSIGYELRPGVAAGTFLAFTLETVNGAPRSARVPIGAKAQSTPAQDETPQVFETTEEIQAFGAWNELRPKQSELVLPSIGMGTIYLKGTSTNLKPGDGLLIVGDERLSDPANENWDFRRVASIAPVTQPDADSSYTAVTLNEGLGSVMPRVDPAQSHPKVYALRQRAALFGYNAPDWRAMPEGLRRQFVSGLFAEYFNNLDFTASTLTRIDEEVSFEWTGSSPDPAIQSDTFSVRWSGLVNPPRSDTYTFHTLSDDGVRLWVNGLLIIDNWTDHRPAENSGTIRLEAGQFYPIRLEYYQKTGAAVIKLSWSSANIARTIIGGSNLSPVNLPSEWPNFNIAYAPVIPPALDTIFLDAVYPQIVANSWVVLSGPESRKVYQVDGAVEESRTNFTLTAKTTRLKLRGERLSAEFGGRVRQTVVFAQSEELRWAEQPITSAVGGNEVELASKVDDLSSGKLVAISGVVSSTGQTAAEIAAIDRIEQAAKNTKLFFKTRLEHTYKRDAVTINANVARATHGDTKEEVMGSGDGSKPFQKFGLKQKPLTFVSTATASGASTTLAVRVNDVLWKEVPSFYQLASTERAYTTRTADDGKVTVQFGDGVTGARVPTGAENISARYRAGIGLSGMLAAGQINLLMSRPLGLNSVTNPLAPTGAEDPEPRDQARRNAPLTVLTLDRIVSLQDFEDFTRAFAGIGKAQATWLWDGEKRLIHLTVAGVDGGEVAPSSDLYRNLVAAIDAARHVDQRVKIDSYKRLLFDIEARLLTGPDYLFAKVQAAVKTALVEAFAFASRSFGQAVTKSEVIAVAQGVKGVIAVDLDKLYVHGSAATLETRLPANIAHWEVNEIKPAELLTVNAGRIALTEITR